MVLLAVVALVFPAYSLRDQVSLWLEDATGETDLRQQMEGLALLATQRPVDTLDLAPVEHAGVYPFGANAFFEQEVEERKLRRSMEMLREAGITWVRQQFPWDRLEIAGKGQFVGPYGPTWEHYDRIVALAQEFGLELVVRLDLPPQWSKVDGSHPRSPPDDFADYGDFVAAVVERYKGWVRYYQVWNEPNLFFEWGRAPDATEYVRLLRTAYERAKKVDPSVVILSAPLAPTLGTPDGYNESDLTYLQKMYDAGARDFFDILSAQGYGLWTGPGDRRADPGQTNFSRVQLLREIMVRNQDARKAIWISEMGWDAVPPDFPGPALHGRVTEEQQARYTVAAYRRIQEEWPWVGAVFYWYFRKVSDAARDEEDFYFRLVDPDFTPRPVYYALQRETQQRPVVHYGWHQEDHWALAYQGRWEQRVTSALPGPRGESYLATKEPGSRITFTFKGSDLTLVTARGPEGGRLAVEIDGSPTRANKAPRAGAGSALIDLRASQREEGVQVPIAAGLENTTHSATFASLDDGQVVIDGLVVTGPRWTFRQGLLGGALSLAAALALGLVIWRWGRPEAPQAQG